MAEVISEVEAGVLDEHRMGQAEGDGNDSPPECRELVETGGEVPVQILKGKGTAGACPEQPKDDDLHRRSGISRLRNVASRPLSRRTVGSEDGRKRKAVLSSAREG